MDSRPYAMISKDHVYAQIESSGQLPTLPGILLALLAACEDRDSSISVIAEIISRDPALSLRVLRLVNSSYYGCRHTFSGIEQAVTYLGVNTIKNLAVTASVHQVFEARRDSGSAPTETGEFWYHSLLSASIAKRISLETGTGNADEAYLAALLHDIGKLLLVSAFSGSYTLNPAAGLHGAEALGFESDTIGVNHAEAGSWLVRQWKLGSLIADAIQYHHESAELVSEAFPLVKIVYLANILAGKAQLQQDRVDELSRTLFGFGHGAFAECVGNAAEEVEQIAGQMGIRVRSVGESRAGADAEPTDQNADDSRHWPESAEAPADPAQAVRTTIAARVRNMSLLSAFQEDLMQAEGPDAILCSFEKAMAILFDISKVLFFLPDHDGVLLCGQASGASSLQQTSRGLSFPVRQSASRIVRAFVEKASEGYLVKDQQGANLADQQILSVFDCSRAYPIPLVVEKTAVGVIVLGLPAGWDSLPADDVQLLTIIARQVALRLHLEQEKSRKAAELERERMAAISMTARKLAHEINNPLGIISNYLVTLKLKLSGERYVLDELTIIDEEIQRISSMVGQMEMYAQAPFSTFTWLDVNIIVRNIIQIAKPSLFNGSGVTVSFIPGADLPNLTTSKDAVKQILINLLKNAAEAMESGGRVIVRTRKSQAEGLGGPGGVEIIVADSGPGLPEAVMDNLYKPFVTTKRNGHSGLGLSIVKKVVNDIGGELSCTSSPREGTAFTIYLPGTLPAGQQYGERA